MIPAPIGKKIKEIGRIHISIRIHNIENVPFYRKTLGVFAFRKEAIVHRLNLKNRFRDCPSFYYVRIDPSSQSVNWVSFCARSVCSGSAPSFWFFWYETTPDVVFSFSEPLPKFPPIFLLKNNEVAGRFRFLFFWPKPSLPSSIRSRILGKEYKIPRTKIFGKTGFIWETRKKLFWNGQSKC